MKEVNKWYIVRVDVNGNQASVSCLCYQPNNYGTYWSSNLKDKHILYYDTEKEAIKRARNISNSACVQNRYIIT